MHVGFVCYGDLDTNTGGFHYDRKLIEGLRDRGDRVKVIELPWRDYHEGLFDSLTGRLFNRLDRSVDVLLEDELAHPSLVGLNRRLRANHDIPLVAIVHHLRCSEMHPWPLTHLYRAVERRYLAGIDGAICNSEATRASAEALATLETTVAPPAGDRFNPEIRAGEIEVRAHDPGPLRVVFLGSLVPRKNLGTLLDGLARVPDERWHLSIIGSMNTEPKYVACVRRRVETLNLDEQVNFRGEITDNAVADVLARSHVVAMPSLHEGFGIAYLEGMSFGLPALATTDGGACEFVSHGVNGFLLRPDNPSGIAHAIRTLENDRTRLARMGVAARKTYEDWPTWTENTEEIRAFLERLVSERDKTGQHRKRRTNRVGI